MRALAVIFGIILLLPGLCSLGFMALFIPEAFRSGGAGENSLLLVLWLVCFAISYGGILMIRYGALGGRDRASPSLPPNRPVDDDERS